MTTAALIVAALALLARWGWRRLSAWADTIPPCFEPLRAVRRLRDELDRRDPET